MAFGPVAKKAPIFEDGFETTAPPSVFEQCAYATANGKLSPFIMKCCASIIFRCFWLLLRNRMMFGDVRVQDSVLGASSAHAVAFRRSAKNSKLCIDKKLAMPNMQLTLTNYGGYHDAIGYQARSNLYGGKAV